MRIESLTQQQIEALVTEWNAEECKHRRILSFASGFMMIMVMIMVSAFVYRWHRGRVKTSDILSLAMVIVAPIHLLLAYFERKCQTSRQKQIMEKLLAYRSKETLPLLLKTMREKIGTDLQPLLLPIAEPLLELKANDAAIYGKYSEQIAHCAYTSLKRNRSVSDETRTFVMAAFQALEQIGSKEAIPIIEKIANLNADQLYAKSLRTAAQECLQALQQRAKEQTAEQTLLRVATHTDDTAQEQLLHPIQNKIP